MPIFSLATLLGSLDSLLSIIFSSVCQFSSFAIFLYFSRATVGSLRFTFATLNIKRRAASGNQLSIIYRCINPGIGTDRAPPICNR